MNLASIDSSTPSINVPIPEDEQPFDDSTEEPQEEVDGDLQLVPFEHAGVKYLKDDENYLYDPETEEEVGFWNGSEVEELEAPLVPEDEQPFDDSTEEPPEGGEEFTEEPPEGGEGITEEPPEGGEGITEEPQEEVDGDLQLVPFEHAGVKYLKDDENYLYDPET